MRGLRRAAATGGFDPNTSSPSATAHRGRAEIERPLLAAAALFGHTEMVAFLLDKGASTGGRAGLGDLRRGGHEPARHRRPDPREGPGGGILRFLRPRRRPHPARARAATRPRGHRRQAPGSGRLTGAPAMSCAAAAAGLAAALALAPGCAAPAAGADIREEPRTGFHTLSWDGARMLAIRSHRKGRHWDVLDTETGYALGLLPHRFVRAQWGEDSRHGLRARPRQPDLPDLPRPGRRRGGGDRADQPGRHPAGRKTLSDLHADAPEALLPRPRQGRKEARLALPARARPRRGRDPARLPRRIGRGAARGPVADGGGRADRGADRRFDRRTAGVPGGLAVGRAPSAVHLPELLRRLRADRARFRTTRRCGRFPTGTGSGWRWSGSTSRPGRKRCITRTTGSTWNWRSSASTARGGPRRCSR